VVRQWHKQGSYSGRLVSVCKQTLWKEYNLYLLARCSVRRDSLVVLGYYPRLNLTADRLYHRT
jgi:hypothetical protein